MSYDPDLALDDRLQTQGVAVLSIEELLAILLRVGRNGESSRQSAENLLLALGSLRHLARCDYVDLVHTYGLRPAQAAQVVAALELGRRLASAGEVTRPVIQNAADAAQLLALEMEKLKQEQLRVLLLDVHRRLIAAPTVYIGSLNVTVVRTAEVFREAIGRNCASLILIHNHPSGDPTPSEADLKLTETLVQAGRLLDIAVLDHVIIGHDRWVSLRDVGLDF